MQAVPWDRRSFAGLLTAEVRIRYQVNPCGIYGGRIVTGTGFYSEFCDFIRRYYSTSAPFSFTLISRTLNNLST